MAESDTPKSTEPSSSAKPRVAAEHTADVVPATDAKSDPPHADRGEQPAAREERDTSDGAYGPSWLPLAIAFTLPVLFFFILPPLTRAGLWVPHELNVADLARRIALNLHGAGDLALEGADNSLPHLNDLGRPQLPFTSIALGFKTFGLHEWAGRSPLAVWGVLGVLATYGWVSRLIDRRAGLFAAVALTTMPLFFVQSRTMLGDICMMSAFAMSFGGLLVAVFDRGDEGESNATPRLLWLAVAAVGLLAGFFTRGAILGVGVPALAVACAFGLSVANRQRTQDTIAYAVGGLAAVVGVYFAYKGLDALSGPRSADLNPWIGAMVKTPTKYPTFDTSATRTPRSRSASERRWSSASSTTRCTTSPTRRSTPFPSSARCSRRASRLTPSPSGRWCWSASPASPS